MENMDKIIRGDPYKYDCNPGGIGCSFFESMNKFKDKTAQIWATSGKKETFGALLERSIKTALHMRKRNLKEGDIVALCSYNHMNSAVPFIAATFLGCIPSSCNPLNSATENKYLLTLIKPKILFVDSECLEMIEEALSGINLNIEILVFGDTIKYTSFSEFLVDAPEKTSFKPVPCKNIKDTCIIALSSGTTGLPKGICLSHYAIMAQSCRITTPLKLVAAFTSLFWISDLIVLIGSLIHGTGRLVCKAFDPVKIWDWIKDYQIQLLTLGPYLLMDAMEKMPEKVDLSSLLVIYVTGTAITLKQLTVGRTSLEDVPILQGYGLSENAGGIIGCMPNEMARVYPKHETLGQVVSGNIVKVVDPETDEILGPNQEGELRVKSDFLLNGYYKQDCSSSFDSDGWYKTGDIVYYDEDKFFYYVERQRDILKFRGHNIIPKVLEDILKTHPAVNNAAVIAIPHDIEGEIVMACVSLKLNYHAVTADEIKTYYDNNVEDHKKLRGGLKIIKEFPLTPTHKIKKNDLRHMVINNLI